MTAEKYRQRKEAGLCVKCTRDPRPAIPGRTECPECNLARKQEHDRWTEQQDPAWLAHLDRLGRLAAAGVPLFEDDQWDCRTRNGYKAA